ncbi:MAG: group 1 truncated hemoglobin [Gammaproteobacteria bacterium]|nr:group 1 truncated hemoglobin [Gammaproteobacteria bacterium]
MGRKNSGLLAASLFAILGYGAAAEGAKGDALFRDLGGREGIARFVGAAVASAHSHPRIAFLFEDADDGNLKGQLGDLICALAAGPCNYEGLGMREAHSGMEITEAEFDIFVELVLDAMEQSGISHSARNRLLALLVPLREDIIHQ